MDLDTYCVLDLEWICLVKSSVEFMRNLKSVNLYCKGAHFEPWQGHRLCCLRFFVQFVGMSDRLTD
jgi:hypothetical protein